MVALKADANLAAAGGHKTLPRIVLLTHRYQAGSGEFRYTANHFYWSLASGEKYIIWLFHDASKQELLFYEWGFLVELGNAFCVHSFALPKVPLLL